MRNLPTAVPLMIEQHSVNPLGDTKGSILLGLLLQGRQLLSPL